MKTKQFKIEDKLALYAHLDKNEIWIYLPPSAEFIKEKGRTIVKISYKKDAKTLGAKVKKLWQQSQTMLFLVFGMCIKITFLA